MIKFKNKMFKHGFCNKNEAPERTNAVFCRKFRVKQSAAIEFIALMFIFFLYVFFTVLDIRLPGIDFDSANFGLHCYDIFKFKSLYLMLHPREGILDAYLVAPLFFFFDDPVAALRYGCIFINGLGLFIFYFFVRKFLKSRLLGLITMLLIVTYPAFINACRHASWNNFNIFLPLSIALFAFQQWYEDNRLFYFFTGIFFLGMALGIRIHSLWIINCLFVCFFVLGVYRRFHGKKQLLKVSMLAAVIFMLGAWNVVLYNITGELDLTPFMGNGFRFSLSKCFGTFTNIFSDVVNNPVIRDYSFAKSFVLTFENFLSVLNGLLLLRFSGYPHSLNLLNTYFFFASLGILFLLLFLRRTDEGLSLKKSKFLLIMCLFVFLQALISPQNCASYHFFILVPFVQLVIVAAFVRILGLFKNSLIVKFGFLIILLLLINQNITVWHRTKLHYRMTGGGNHHSDTIYRLVDWLEDNRELCPVDVDWGFSAPIRFLSKKQISTIDFYAQFDVLNIDEYLRKKDDLAYFKEKWKNIFLYKKNIFLVFQNSITSNSEKYVLFLKLSQEFGLKPKVIKSFYTRDNKLVYNVFRLE